MPSDNTFDKYQKAYFREKRFDVDVKDGQLNLEFQGENWGCSVSAVVIFPVDESRCRAKRFSNTRKARRRFYFDNYFKRVLPEPSGEPLRPTAEERRRGFVAFQRDPMQDVSYNDTPRKNEIVDRLKGEAFARRIRADDRGARAAARPGQGSRERERPCRSRARRSLHRRLIWVTSRIASAG